MSLSHEPACEESVFAYQWEKVYFDHWMKLAGNMGGGWFPSVLWTQTMAQLSNDEPAIRYAMIAIGAIGNAMAPTMKQRSFQSLMASGPHYQNALTYYGRALRHVRLSPSAGEDGVRTALVSCILFIIFEALNGQREAVVRHINYGLMILEQFARAKGGAGYEMLTSSPAPYVIEDEIVQIFQRLNFHAWSQACLRPKTAPPNLGMDVADGTTSTGTGTGMCEATASAAMGIGGGTDDSSAAAGFGQFAGGGVGFGSGSRSATSSRSSRGRRSESPPEADKIPAQFSDLVEARRWFDLVQHWWVRFPRTIASLGIEIGSGGGMGGGGGGDFGQGRFDFDGGLSDVLDPSFAATTATGDDDGDDETLQDWCEHPLVAAEQARYLELLGRWHAAFAPVFAEARRTKRDNMHGYLRAVSVQAQYLLLVISVRTVCFSSFEGTHASTPQFRELVRLAGLLLPHQPRHGRCIETFTLDNGLVLPLWVTACKCRDAEVRAEATRLLERYPRRDGLWDSRAMRAIALANRTIEMENREPGDGLKRQWFRLRCREAAFNERGTCVTIRGMRRDRMTGQWVMRDAIVEW